MSYTYADLKEMQSWPLERKIQVSQTRILEFGMHYDGLIYVSFSGGKDSTVLLDLARRVYPDVPAVFVNTGVEFPEVKQFVKTIDNVMWLKPKKTFAEVIDTYGYPIISKEVSQKIYEARRWPNSVCRRLFDADDPFAQDKGRRYNMVRWKWLLDSDIPISHMCCHELKKAPAKQYEHKTKRKPLIGILAEESTLRTTEWIKNGCNAFDLKRPRSHPLSFWREQDIFEYIVRFNLPICSIYGEITQNLLGDYSVTGRERTGCIFCGFGCHTEGYPNRFQLLKQTHPKLWDYAMRPRSENGLGMKEVLEFIKVPIE